MFIRPAEVCQWTCCHRRSAGAPGGLPGLPRLLKSVLCGRNCKNMIINCKFPQIWKSLPVIAVVFMVAAAAKAADTLGFAANWTGLQWNGVDWKKRKGAIFSWLQWNVMQCKIEKRKGANCRKLNRPAAEMRLFGKRENFSRLKWNQGVK